MNLKIFTFLIINVFPLFDFLSRCTVLLLANVSRVIRPKLIFSVMNPLRFGKNIFFLASSGKKVNKKQKEYLKQYKSGFFALAKDLSNSYTIFSTEIVLKYLILSLPRKSSVIQLSTSKRMCSTRSEQQPTVSASSSPFSFPTRKASLSIRYVQTPSWLSVTSSLYIFFM